MKECHVLIDDLSYAGEEEFDFARHSSIGCGGKAEAVFYPQTIEQTLSLIRNFDAKRVPFIALGNLTNVLPPDGKWAGSVLSTKRLKGIGNTDGGVFALAGVTSGELINACKRYGYSGAEFLEGIPCTLGGALFMNAGVSGKYIADIVESVTVVRGGELLELKKEDCRYFYKSSIFMQSGETIVGAKLRLTEASQEEIEKAIGFYRQRRAHLPKGKSMGCVFKNPENNVAGKLIEGAGLKGLRVGGAVVSKLHANFIINDNGATAADIKSLIQIVKNAVFAQYKIRLEEEIRYIT